MEDFEQLEEYDEAPAQSSIAAPLLRALLFAALAFGIYALIFGDLGGGDDLGVDTTPSPVAVAPTEIPVPPPIEALPTVDPVAPTTPATVPTAAPTAGATPGSQIGAGVTVQVIAGSQTTGDQFAAAVAALRELGYDVTEAGVSGNAYAQTTVFATAGEEAQASALVAADDRFSVVGDNPGNLTAQLQIHVLVGEDWPT